VASPASAPVSSDYEDFSGQLLAVPEEEDVWSEEETCHQLLLNTEAPGTPEKNEDRAPNEIEYGVTASMGPLDETAPPLPENAGEPLKRGCGCPRKVFPAFTLHEDYL
jgi:hypothetical protein